jgi:signal transduction histidine kinase/ActR/RegA family two-component response regulator
MIRFSDFSIRRKLTLTTVAASGLALLLASAAFMVYDYQSTGETVVRRLSGDAEIIGMNGAPALVFHDPEAAAQTLAALQAEPGVIAAAIYTAEGRLFARYERARNGAAPPAEITPADGDRPAHRFDGELVTVVRPIVFDGTRVGSLLIRSDLTERTARLRRFFGIAFTVSLVSLLAAMLVGRLAQRAIADPLLSLAETSRRITKADDFSVRAVAHGVGDELGVLVSTFNNMLEGLQRRDAELKRTQGELERQVEERTQLHRQAEEANRLKDQFLATLSHELRTPLNAIVGWSSMLAAGQLDAETQARAIATIDRNARAQTKLINDVLDVSRIVSGKLQLNIRPVDLAGVVAAAAEAVSHAAAARQVRVELDVDTVLGEIPADPDRLQQVLWNLLSNAIKFTPAGGRVTVEATRTAAHIEVVVKDNGAGIPAEFLPHVFERFRQADASITRTHGGLGLGLAIVRYLVELHGGTVGVQSDGAGKGAVFTVRLPLAPALAQAVAAEAVAAAETSRREPGLDANLAGVRVLVVEDEPDSRDLIRALIERCGASVTTVASALDALAAFDAEVPDLVVSDVEMPGMDGYSLMRQLRTRAPERGGDVPAVAVSAHVRPEDRARALASGFQHHVGKPIETGELLSTLAILANRARRGGEPRPARLS